MFVSYQANKYTNLRTVLCLLIVCATTVAQNPRPKEQDEVVRVFTELVQTDVMVFDKEGHFVNGLRPENFELRIDGKVRPIEAFEQITAGSNEENQLAAARGTEIVAAVDNSKRPIPLDRGRTVFFYVDDLHLDISGLNATKKLITNFIDKEMGQNDEAAIISASGQIGFLQQLTDNRLVLQEALKRISPRTQVFRDYEPPAMTEYNALLIDKNDYDMVGYFVDETIKRNPGLTRDIAASMVRSRAGSLLAQASRVTTGTLYGLSNTIQAVKGIPGRKVLFLLSNGFLIENSHSDSLDKVRQIVGAAAKAGVVIYSMDARGLVAPFADASSDTPFDPSGRLDRAAHDELFASQDGLNALARDTGGKAIFNTNDFKPGLKGALKETSVYYLLAWKPDKTSRNPGRFRNIEVSIVGRSDLVVRVRRGFYDSVPPAATSALDLSLSKPAKGAADQQQQDPGKVAAKQLRETITAPYPEAKIPLSLSLDYQDVAGRGPIISASVQIPGEFMAFAPQGEKIQALVDVAGAFYNDRGQPASVFFESLVTTAPSVEAARDYHGDITYTYPVTLSPGLYQARLAVRDSRSGQKGSIRKWIEVPDLSKHELALSSVLVGEHPQPAINNVSHNNDETNPVALNASHRFSRESSLRFLVFVYNASNLPANSKPDAGIQVQVLRDGQPVMTTALRKLSTEGVLDLERIPYAAEIPLKNLGAGRYVLRVTVIDLISKHSASQQTHFDVN